MYCHLKMWDLFLKEILRFVYMKKRLIRTKKMHFTALNGIKRGKKGLKKEKLL